MYTLFFFSRIFFRTSSSACTPKRRLSRVKMRRAIAAFSVDTSSTIFRFVSCTVPFIRMSAESSASSQQGADSINVSSFLVWAAKDIRITSSRISSLEPAARYDG